MPNQKIKAIVTGTTGMVGEGVLHECLNSPDVESVLIINRRPLGLVHPKLKEIIHQDFFDITPIENELAGYNACFFCLGISSVGVSKDEYLKMTYTLTMHVAEILAKHNPDMTFDYVSGAGTDSSEKGSLHWARVKGKTENDLMALPFKQVYAFRPGFILPTKGLKNTHKFYHYIGWMFPILRSVFPSSASTLVELGQAMIRSVNKGYEKKVLEVKDIIVLSKR
jgi:nucleoside-diphosphate-sugar epimerase